MGLFGSLKDFAKATGREKNPIVVGLDIGNYSVKAVALEDTKEGPLVRGYAELVVDKNDLLSRPSGVIPEKAIEAVGRIFKEGGIDSFNCGIGIPFASSLATVISTPPLDDEKLAGIIPIEARKYIPVPVNDVYLDWQRIVPPEGATRSTEDKVLLFAIHKTAVEAFEQVVSALNLQATLFEMEIFSTARVAAGDQPQPIIVVDIGASYSRLCVVKDGQILSTRKINRGGFELTKNLSRTFHIEESEAEEIKKTRSLLHQTTKFDQVIGAFYKDIGGEVRKITELYQKEWGGIPTSVALVGGASNIQGIEEFFYKETSISSKKILPFFGMLTEQDNKKIIERAGPEFAVATGVALRKIALRT